MDLKQTLENAKHAAGDMLDRAKDAVENAQDAIGENVHRATADAEREKREVAGENMTTGEHIASNANELKNRAQAEVDSAKQDIRNA